MLMKVLLIEDDAETAAYIMDGLTETGLVVDHANNGRDGLVFAAGESYDVIIVDRMLPGLDGLGIVKTIRGAGVSGASTGFSAVEVVVVSGAELSVDDGEVSGVVPDSDPPQATRAAQANAPRVVERVPRA